MAGNLMGSENGTKHDQPLIPHAYSPLIEQQILNSFSVSVSLNFGKMGICFVVEWLCMAGNLGN